MPAVDVENILTLPTVPTADPQNAVMRPVRSITTAPRGFEGEGFPVRRAFAGVSLANLDPFIHMDQMGEVEYAPGEPKGTSWHPHRGFETVTYMIDGIFEHQDSHGGGGVITNGDTQWMTAGGGILHIERPPEHLVESGGLFHGLQLWVNLPSRDKMITPRYQDLRGNALTLLRSADGGALVRLIAGDMGEHRGPGSTYTPITIVHATISPDAEVDLPWRPDFNALVYILSGAGYVGQERIPIQSGQLAVLGSGNVIRLGANRAQESRGPNLEVYLMGGQPIREPVAHYGFRRCRGRCQVDRAHGASPPRPGLARIARRARRGGGCRGGAAAIAIDPDRFAPPRRGMVRHANGALGGRTGRQVHPELPQRQ